VLVDADAVADVDLAVLEDVGAQAASVNQGAKKRAWRVPVHHPAWLAEPHAAAPHVADHELATDQTDLGLAVCLATGWSY
jgi:hypothetical protein